MRLVGSATPQRGRDISVIRVFDYFTGMTGKGSARAPMHYEGEDFRTDAYNTEGQQWGFHRGADDDEIWFQFRGHALNETEWGNHELDPLEMGYVPRGIAHRITRGCSAAAGCPAPVPAEVLAPGAAGVQAASTTTRPTTRPARASINRSIRIDPPPRRFRSLHSHTQAPMRPC